MKKQITNFEAEAVASAIKDLLALDTEMSTTVGFPLVYNFKQFSDPVDTFRRERDRLIKYYSGGKDTLDKNDNPEGYAKCLGEIDKLGKMVIDVDVREIDPDDLAGLNVPLKAMSALMFITKDDGEIQNENSEV